VCQILEVNDEWNILKCTLYWRRVQNISITLANLEEFLVISIFHEIKIPMVDMKVQLYSRFRKIKFDKKRNLQSPWGMEHLTLPSVGASFKKWRCCTSIFPKVLAHSPIFQKKKKKKNSLTYPGVDLRPAWGRQPGVVDLWSPDCRRPMVGVWSPGRY
jgi:hypothetical protein